MGITVSVDTGQTFESGAAQYIAVAKLDANTFIVAYQDNDDSNHGKVVVGTRSGTTIYISESDIVQFSSGDIQNIDVCALSPTLFIISYNDVISVPYVSYVVAGSVSGTTITLGSAVVSQSVGSANSTTVCKVDSTNFVASEIVSNTIYSVTGVVSGTTITLGAVVTFVGGKRVKSANLNSTDFILTYEYGFLMYAVVGIVDTTTQTITFGTAKYLGTGYLDWTYSSVASFDYNHFICFACTATDNRIVAGAIGTGATRPITIGTLVSDTTNITNLSICTMDSTHFLVSYKDADDSNYGKVRAGSLTGSTTLAWDDEGAITFDTAIITYTGVCNLDGEYFLVGFKHT